MQVLSLLTLFDYLGMCESNSEHVVTKPFVHKGCTTRWLFHDFLMYIYLTLVILPRRFLTGISFRKQNRYISPSLPSYEEMNKKRKLPASLGRAVAGTKRSNYTDHLR